MPDQQLADCYCCTVACNKTMADTIWDTRGSLKIPHKIMWFSILSIQFSLC